MTMEALETKLEALTELMTEGFLEAKEEVAGMAEQVAGMGEQVADLGRQVSGIQEHVVELSEQMTEVREQMITRSDFVSLLQKAAV